MKESKKNKEINIDITSGEQYLAILNSLTDPMHIIDKDYKIRFLNSAMIEWLKKLKINSDIVNNTIFEAFPFLEYNKIHNEYIDVFKTGKILNTTEITNLPISNIFTETLKIPVRNNGKVEQVITIMRDITKQKEADDKLKASEEKYRNIISNLMDIIIILDLKGNFQYVSPQVYSISGFKPEEIIGKSGFKFMHADDIRNATDVLKEAMNKKKKVYIEYRAIHKNGHYIDVSASGRIVNIEGEDKIFAVVKDISDQKRSEQKLKESEEKYRYLIENALEGVWVIDSNAVSTLVNPSMAKILGYSVDEMIGKSLFSFMDADQKKITTLNLEKRKKGISEERDAVFTHKNSHNVYLRIRGTPILDSEGNYEGTYAFLTDITQRTVAEKKLRESEKKFRNIFEAIPMGMFLLEYTSNGKLVFRESNPASDKILNLDTSQYINKTIEEAFPPLITTDIPDRYKKLAREGGTWKWDQVDYKDEKIQGAYEVVAFQTTPGLMVTSFNDITNRIEADNMLKESEEKFRTIAEQSFMGIIILQDGIIKYFNEQAVKMNGYSIEEIRNWKPYEFQKLIYPDDRDFVIEHARKKQTGDPDVVSHYRYRVVKKNGEVIWVENFSKTINYKGKPADFVMTIDISDKTQADQKLKESEEKYRLISENTDDLIAVYNKDGIVEYLNAETHTKILGYKAEKFFDKSFRDELVYKDDREIGEQSVSEGLKKGYFYYQFRLKHQNGNYLWFEVTGKAFTDNFGNNKLLCVSRNIDEKKLAEDKIKESEENFRTIAEQALMGILIIQDNKVEYVNNALLQIFEFSHEEIDNWKSEDLIKLIYPEDLQYLREYRKRIRSSEYNIKPYYTYRAFTKYGKIKWIDQFSKNIIYRGKPAELITIMDITEKKKAEEELIKLNSLKSELLRRTSHELKTPLVSIKGFSDLLLTVHKEKLDDYVIATIREIKLGCERLENLIQDILKTAELESDSVALKKSEEDLSFLIKLCVKELQGLIKLRNHEINLEIHDKIIAHFEPDQIHLVVSNILNNAIKYTPPNGKIEIRSAIRDDSVLISIHDNGIGLTYEEKKRLFSQFGKIERYGQGLDIISDGSGLGLFITKKIIELHGGRIWVRSKGRNKGSTFYFTLPLNTEDN